MATQSPTKASGLSGRTLGDFVVGELIGEGGFGQVYLAEQPLLERQAVIKVLRARHADNQPTIARFLREARLASRLDHPYAAHIYAFGAEDDGLLWIAMELVRGTPLDEWLDVRGPIAIERFVPLLSRLAEVIHTAHEQSIVHRDIKPGNVMVVVRAGRLLPKLLDFGISKATGQSPLAAEKTVDTMAARVGITLSGAKFATQQGLGIGSPPYMAPEQWVDPANVGPQSDQYALAALTYEALTGKLAFDGKSLRQIAKAHAKVGIPPLGGAFDGALDDVLRRATAKLPNDRFADVVEFAEAFRAAAGLDGEALHLPQLDSSLLADLTATAPQPVAETVARLEASRNVHQARDNLFDVHRCLCHFVGVVGLACRAAIGSGDRVERAATLELLRALRAESPPPARWLEVVRAMCEPFAGRSALFPVPELVELLWPTEEQRSTPPFDELEQARQTAEREVGAREDVIRSMLTETLPQLTRLLRQLTPLWSYRLTISNSDGECEFWSGLRRPRRPMPGKGDLAPSDVALTDGSGTLVLALSPLLTACPPAPGADDELFWFDGPGKSDARMTSYPHGYERGDESVWPWFSDRLLPIDGDTEDKRSERAPYLGLAAFGADDADVYFGREHEVAAAANRLRNKPWLAVVGPSGAGKSSFVFAGLVPALRSYRVLSVRPGSQPLQALVSLLESDSRATDRADELENRPALLGDWLLDMVEQTGDPILLVVDQFEELFTLCQSDPDREAFAAAIVGATRQKSERVRLVLTLRDDFLIRAETLPSLRERLATSMTLLTTPSAAELRRIILEPARRAGYGFDSDALPDRMVHEVEGKPGALALLSFTASKLWELRDRQFKQMRAKAYDALGGVGGALAQHAEETLESMTNDQRTLVREAFRHLVTAEGTRAVLTRGQLEQLLSGAKRATPVVEALIGARLLSASESESGDDQIEVTHEALLSAWPRLVKWRQEDAEGARLRDQLRSAAKQWDDRGRPRGLLWRGEALTEYELWTSRFPGRVTDVEQNFGDASLADAARGRRLRRVLLFVAGVALVLTSIFFFTLSQSARRSEQKAQASASAANESEQRAQTTLATLQTEQARLALLDQEPLRALPLLYEAARGGADSDAFSFLAAHALRATQPPQFVFDAHTGGLRFTDVSKDETTYLSASDDGRAILWDLTTGAKLREFTTKGKLIRSAFSPDQRLVGGASTDGNGYLWRLESGEVVHRLAHDGPVFSIEFSPDGRHVVTASMDGTCRVWNVASGDLVSTIKTKSQCYRTAIDPTGVRVFAGSADSDSTVYSFPAGKKLYTIPDKQLVTRGAWSPTGDLIAVFGENNTITVASAKDGAIVSVLNGHEGNVVRGRFLDSGRGFLSASADGKAIVWDVEPARIRAVLLGHEGMVATVAVSDDETTAVTGGDDGSLIVWDLKAGVMKHRISGHTGPVRDVHLLRDGRYISASEDTSAKVWQKPPHIVETVAYADGEIARAAQWRKDGLVVGGTAGAAWYSADGQVQRRSEQNRDVRAVAVDEERGITVLGVGSDVLVRTRALRVELPFGAEVRRIALSRDGALAAVAGQSDEVALISLDDGVEVGRLPGHGEGNLQLAFDERGDVIAGTLDGRVIRWRVENNKQVVSYEGDAYAVECVELSHDGDKLIVGGGEGKLRTFDYHTGELLRTGEHTWQRSIRGCTMHPTLALLAVVGLNSVDFVDLATGRLLGQQPLRSVHELRFSPTGERLLALDDSGNFHVIRVDVESVPEAALEEASRCRSPFELRDGLIVAKNTPPEC